MRLALLGCFLILACSSEFNRDLVLIEDTDIIEIEPPLDFGDSTKVINPLSVEDVLNLNLETLENYENQFIPNYITKDNTPETNPISNEGATLGRVLFYDKNLSSDKTVSCSSCHKQKFAFGDIERRSQGVNGLTTRHSMRLINARFSEERKYFWDERAASLEEQVTTPIKNHIEMGFSGQSESPVFQDLLTRLNSLDYYKELFFLAFKDSTATEERIQKALSQFIRSIQSFDSKFDEGRSQVISNGSDFPNFTVEENAGKRLFLAPVLFNQQGQRIGGGANCAVCHRAPEFDIDPNSLSTTAIFRLDNQMVLDTVIRKSPSIRDIVNPNDEVAPLFHDAMTQELDSLIGFYNLMTLPSDEELVTIIDARLRPNGFAQNLRLTEEERTQLIAFLKTLTGIEVYVAERWSNPFKDEFK